MSESITFFDQERSDKLTKELELMLENFFDQWDVDLGNISCKFDLSGEGAKFIVNVATKFYEIDDNKYKDHFKKNYKRLGIKLEALDKIIKTPIMTKTYSYYRILGSIPYARKYRLLVARYREPTCSSKPDYVIKVSERWVKSADPTLKLENE